MKWLIPYKTAQKLRKLSIPLFYEEELSLTKKRIIFWRVLNSSLLWIHTRLVEIGLDPCEADSEIFILCCELFDKFDINKSSIIPYIENNIRFKAAELMRKVKKDPAILSGLLQLEGTYEMDNEVYLTSPGFLFENKWLAKNLSQAQKNLILKILTTDPLTKKDLANRCRLSKNTVRTQLQNIAIAFKGRLLK